MSITALLQELRSHHISVSVQGENLKINAPAGSLSPELKQQLGEHKAALIRWLQESHVAEELALPICIPDVENRALAFPLSDMQYGFYMGDDPYMEFHVRPHYYIEKNPVDFDVARYQAAWNKALTRHRAEIVVVRPDGQLEQVIDPAPLICNLVNLGEVSESEIQLSLAAIRKSMMRSQLPLDTWPWLDLRVTQWRKDGVLQSRIHYNHNNFFSDGYGTTRLLQEIDAYYENPELTLAPLTLSFRDAAKTLDELALSKAGKAAQAYWENRLPKLPSAPALPIHAHLDKRCRSRLQRREGFISQSSWTQFKQHAATCGLTPSNAIFCAYAEIMSAWGNTRHFILSNMMTRRLNIHPEIKDIIGNFASLYPLEIDFRESNRFLDRARNLQERVILDAKHLHWGGMQVMQALNRQKGSLGTAAVPFVIGSGLFMEGFTRSDFSCLETSQVMLDHQFWEMPDGSYYYVWDLLEEFFPEGVIDSMWETFHALIEQLATDATLWHSEVLALTPAPMLANRARHCPPPTPAPSGLLQDCLPQKALLQASMPALYAANSQSIASLSYAQLEAASNRLARALLSIGNATDMLGEHQVQANLVGKTIAIVAQRGVALFQAVYGVLKAGAAYVPVDPNLPEDRRNYILENCEAHAVFCEVSYRDSLRWPEQIPVLAIEPNACELSSPWSAGPIKSNARAHDLAYLIYTSGSTGRPKGVMIEHEGAMNTIHDVNQRFAVGPADKLFGVSSFGFDLSVYDLFGSIAAGASLVFPDPEQSLNPSHWLDLMLELKTSIWNSAPPLATLLIEAAENRRVTLPLLRLVLLSGDWIAVDLPDRIRRIAPNATVISMGGATEASIWSIIYPINAVDPSWRSIPYGYPMQNQSWFILDDWGRPTPELVSGDLFIGGIGLARGYWQDQDKTKAAFIAHPETGERIYRTGDLGCYRPDGSIEFLGRKDSQVKVSGHRIELGEIESVLVLGLGVSAAVATVQSKAGGSAQLVAFIVPKAHFTRSDIDLDALHTLLASKLPEYMLPRVIEILDRLPLSSNGKVDRKLLPLIDAKSTKTSETVAREARDETEIRLLAIWRNILGQATLTVIDDFFDFGGQSFEAVRIIGAIRESFGISISLGVIWQHRTVAEVAKQIDASLLALKSNAANTKRDGNYFEPLGYAKLLQTLRATGKNQTLFLVHPAGGHVMCYRALAAQLDRPVFAFQASGLEANSQVLDSITNMAHTYVQELILKQESGPILLGGWSSGALIAYEMAHQLRARGREVNGILMFDCPAPHPGAAVDSAVLLAWFLEDLALALPVTEIIAARSFENLKPLQQLHEVAAVLKEMGTTLPIDLSQLSPIYEVFIGIVRGSKNYQGSHIDVDLLLLRASDGVVSEFADNPASSQNHWGWAGFTSGEVITKKIPACHYTLIKEPSLSNLTATVEDWLNRKTQTAKMRTENQDKSEVYA